MTEITRCNRIGFHYNGFLNVLDNSNPAYNAKSSIKIFKKIYFCSNCGTWVNAPKIPADILKQLCGDDYSSLNNTYGDPSWGEPIQYDYLRLPITCNPRTSRHSQKSAGTGVSLFKSTVGQKVGQSSPDSYLLSTCY